MIQVINELLEFNQNEGIFMVLLFFKRDIHVVAVSCFFAKFYTYIMANSAAQKRGLL